MRELWDVYDIYRNKTGKVHERGRVLIKGEYYLVVNIWILDSKNRILLTKRNPKKRLGNYWECTGGFVQKGENSLDGAIREVYEEIGLKLDRNNGILLYEHCRKNYLVDTWLFKRDLDISELNFRDGEVIDAKLVSRKEYDKMCEKKIISPNVRNFYKINKD